MKITFSPIRMDAHLTAEVEGEVLTLNGEAQGFGGGDKFRLATCHEALFLDTTIARRCVDSNVFVR